MALETIGQLPSQAEINQQYTRAQMYINHLVFFILCMAIISSAR